jgi:hypothetical protein
METADDPIGFFITWTVYGTFLQGDDRWWRKSRHGSQTPQPLLQQWHRDRLKYDVVTLTDDHREIVRAEIRSHCQHRAWKLWIANPRSTHVHVVVTALGYAGSKVRDQLKANCTRGLRENDRQFVDRPVWTEGGDWQCLNSDDELEQAIMYAGEAQDRMEFK